MIDVRTYLTMDNATSGQMDLSRKEQSEQAMKSKPVSSCIDCLEYQGSEVCGVSLSTYRVQKSS